MAMANSISPLHTVLHLSCPKYQAIRQKLGPRRTFFNDLQALTRYLFFPRREVKGTVGKRFWIYTFLHGATLVA